MTSPISGPLHQAVDTLAGPAADLATRLRSGGTIDLVGWSDSGGIVRGVDAVAREAARWWAPATVVDITVLDGVGVDEEHALVELAYVADGATLALGHAVVGLRAGQDVTWRQHGDPTAAARGVEVPAFPRRKPATPDDPAAAARQQAVVLDFFDRHDRIGGVLEAWERYAADDVLLWHSAEGVRARGRNELLAFYAAQHERYPYAAVGWELHHVASRPGYTAGEITYTLTHEERPTIVLPASFGVDLDGDDRIVAWRDYSRAWIPT